MEKLIFYIVDVFAVERYTGNQLAVFINGETESLNGQVLELSAEQMQQIAKEINYSETTFITSKQPQKGGYNVRIFTPKKELPFAGHPTLGTAYIIQKEIIKNSVEAIKLNLPVGQIPVTWHKSRDTGEVLWMRQNSPTFHQKFDSASLAAVLNLDLYEIDSRFPIQEVSTGTPFIIVPLTHQEALKRINLNKDKYFELIDKTESKALLVFCPETYAPENDLSVRVFAEYLGIPEDPATGSANGCLAGYLVEYSYFGDKAVDIRVEQGYEIDRPSLLLLRAEKNQDMIDVSVGGKVVLIAKGEFFQE
ncbi:MAG: PhzF family phenazine biosynthesis protein [Symploca sp. SIO2C1]|nr:PhzF family phenazine biosynthesis protein [Symploca sp. SIO2C1]